MSTNTLIALDLVATAIIIILFSIRLLFSKRIKHSAALSRSYRMNQEPRPGVIFCFLTGVKDIFRTELGKNGRYARIDTIKDHLKMIINDPGKKHSDMDIADARFDFDEDQKLIIKNLAQCLITFLNQLRTEQEPALFDYTQFEAGLAEIVSAINQFFNQDITYKKFMNKIISGKNQIFLSLLGGRKYDLKTTYDFLKDLRKITKIPTPRYLKILREDWINNHEALRKIRPDLIIPLFTIKNTVDGTIKNNDRAALEKLKRLIVTGKFRKIISFGVKFDKNNIPAEFQIICDRIARAYEIFPLFEPVR